MQPSDLQITNDLLDFIEKSPTCFSAVQNVQARLDAAGFTRLCEQNPFVLQPGGKYYLTRNLSSLLAFQLPEAPVTGFMVAASHSDSPGFKLKTDCELPACEHYVRLNTERYGGGILSSWFDRPLSLAGRAIVRENGQFVTRVVDLERDLAVIPNVCIHFNRTINDGYKYNAAVDTLPLLCEAQDKGVVRRLVAKRLNVAEDDVAATDLYLYVRPRGCIFGADDAFFLAPRIDDLQCAFATLLGFLQSAPTSAVSVYALFDNEEVGSSTKQGAGSGLLFDALTRIADALGKPLSLLLPSSMMLSCDNGHAKHPNHPELSDGQNAPHMNGGVVIKHNANQHYTTDAVSEALFMEICRRADVPVQHFANRSDLAGGSTLGSISNTRVAMNTVDVGLAQLAMHSACETAGVADTAALVRAASAFYNTAIRVEADGVYGI